MRIRNVAVIDRLEVDFEPGLNLLTGETGAGKSILIDALGLVLGSRASTDLVRSGADAAVVEAGFEVQPMPRSLARRLREVGVEVEDEIVIRRELQASGRGKVTVNGVAASRQVLRDISPYLADIHGQGESSSLLRAEAGLDLLDRFGGTREERREAREAFRETRRLEAEIARVERRGQEREKRKREIEEALDEIEKAAPRAGRGRGPARGATTRRPRGEAQDALGGGLPNALRRRGIGAHAGSRPRGSGCRSSRASTRAGSPTSATKRL